MLLEQQGLPIYRPPAVQPACNLISFPEGLPLCLASYARRGVYDCPGTSDAPCAESLRWLLEEW